MTGRVTLILSAVIGLALMSGCHAGSWRCQTGSCHLDHAMGISSDCGGCGLDSCHGCAGHDAQCSTCGVSNCGGAHGPFEHLRQLSRNAVCGSGCGEIYWGEWISDPPDCCDPCDNYGNFTGMRSGCPPRRGLPALRRLLLGYRHGSSCGCATCAGGPATMTEFYPQETIIETVPGEDLELPQPIPDSAVQFKPSEMNSIMNSGPSDSTSSSSTPVRKINRSTGGR